MGALLEIVSRKMQKHKKTRFVRRSGKEMHCLVISNIQDQYENKIRILLYEAGAKYSKRIINNCNQS